MTALPERERSWALKGGVGYWVTLARAMLAMALGLALILYPDRTRPMLVNFMGMFWLAAGVMSLRWSPSGRRAPRASRVAGAVGIVAGLLVLSRLLVKQVDSDPIAVTLLGMVSVLTGILHVSGWFEREITHRRLTPLTSIILGAFEIVLGTLLLASHADPGRAVYLAATAWSFAGAAMLIGDALRMRSKAATDVKDAGPGSETG